MAKVFSKSSSQDVDGSTPKDTGSTDADKNRNDKQENPTIQESGVSTQDLKTRIGRVYGSNVELIEGKDGDVFTAKLETQAYGTRTVVMDGRGESAEEARTSLWNRIPMYKGHESQYGKYPHDYARPNAV